MTLRGSLVVFLVGTLLAWGAWLTVLMTVPPDGAGAIGESFFFGALLLALAGTLTMLGVLGRMRFSSALPSVHLSAAFRQGMLIAIAVVGALLLQRFHVLQWWNMLLLVLVLLGMDILLTGRRRLSSP